MKKRRKLRKPKHYWNNQTDEAIIWYNITEDQFKRDFIWRSYLERPFNKLAENIINRFKFIYLNQSYFDTKNEVISFLLINIHKFDPTKGKSFSYFSIVAKNYLILNNNNNWKDEKRSIYLSDVSEDNKTNEEVLKLEAPDTKEITEQQEFVKLLIDYWYTNIDMYFDKKRDREICLSIMDIFGRRETLDFFNKKYIYYMVKELYKARGNSECTSNHITKVLLTIKPVIYEQFKNFINFGTLDKPLDEQYL